jgi:circadian clock protein KaiC
MRSTLGRVSTGVSGLDEVLDGGLVTHRTYMLRGPPGAGKSILGLHFPGAGVDAGDDVLYVNVEEPVGEIKQNAAALGLDTDGIDFVGLSPDSEFFADDLSYDVFSLNEVENEELTDRISERVEEVDPNRIFVDPITQLRYLSPDEYRFREEMLSFMQFLKKRGATVLFTSQDTSTTPDDDLQFMCDGVVELDYIEQGRTVAVPKFRGSAVRGGNHALRIEDGGIEVYPRLVPCQHAIEFEAETISSGVPELDRLLNGGLERGTVTIVTGSPGVGKTTIGVQFMKEAGGRGGRPAPGRRAWATP